MKTADGTDIEIGQDVDGSVGLIITESDGRSASATLTVNEAVQVAKMLIGQSLNEAKNQFDAAIKQLGPALTDILKNMGYVDDDQPKQ